MHDLPILGCWFHVRLSSNNGLMTDVAALRICAITAIEDEGPMFLLDPDRAFFRCPKPILVEKAQEAAKMLPEPIAYCFYRYRGLCLHTWIVTTFTIIVAGRSTTGFSGAQTRQRADTSLGLIDKAPPSGPLFLPSYPTVESGPLHGAAYLYDKR